MLFARTHASCRRFRRVIKRYFVQARNHRRQIQAYTAFDVSPRSAALARTWLSVIKRPLPEIRITVAECGLCTAVLRRGKCMHGTCESL